MNNKVYIELLVPMLETSYDVFLPINRKGIEIVHFLNQAISELSDGAMPITNSLNLIFANGQDLDYTKTLKENQVQNGMKLILI